MIDDAELVAAIEERPYWYLDDHGAVYAPPGAVPYVRVRKIRTPTWVSGRYAASVIEDEALQFTTMPTAAAAIAWSERRSLEV